MQNSTNIRLTVLTASMTALFAPALYAAGAGQVDFATPGVNAIGPNGQSRPVAKGSEIQPGETIDTGAGRAQVRFTDGGYVSLQPQTQFRLESYGYDKDDPKKNGIVMNLLKGGLRTITGLIGKTNREGYKLQTATATVGIRGTEFSITGFPDGSIVFHTTDGAIDVSNNTGSTTVPGGQSVTVTSPNTPPSKTDEKPFLPPAVTLAQTQLPTTNQNDSTTASNPVTASSVQAIPAGTYFGNWRTISNANGMQYGAYGTNSSSGYDGSFVPYTSTTTGTGSFTVAQSGHVTDLTSTMTTVTQSGYGAPYTVTSSSVGTTFSLGSGTAQSYGNDGVMAWGRWSGQTSVAGSFEGSTDHTAYPLHYVVGLPATNVPTSGSATYNMYGGTAPTCVGPSCGNISVGGSLTVNFASVTGSFVMNYANSGDGVKVTNTGGLYFDRNQNVNFLGATSTTASSGAAVYYANTTLDGFLAGSGASHAGAVYNINYSAVSATGATMIYGAAVYKK